MNSLPRMALLFMVLLATLASGCRRHKSPPAPPPPKNVHYLVRFVHDVTPAGLKRSITIYDPYVEGATLVVDGVEAGVLTRRGNDEVSAFVDVATSHLFFDRSVKLALRFPTPCGETKEVALPTYTTNMTSREMERPASGNGPGAIDVKRGGEEPPPNPAAIWVDDQTNPKAKIMFGSAEITGAVTADDVTTPLPGRRRMLWDMTCKKTHDVTIDGVKVGTAKSTGELATAFLVSTDPTACYQRVNHRYAGAYDSMTGPGSSYFDIPPGQVNAVKWAEIDYFLRRAPSAVKGDFGEWRSSLQRVTCKRTASATGE